MSRRCEKNFWDGTYRRSIRILCIPIGEHSQHLENIFTSDSRSSIDAANNVSRRQLLRHMDIQHIKITEDPIEHVHSQPGDIRYNNGF